MSCIFAITVSCFLFIIIMLSLPDLLFQTYENFFSQDLGNNEKIFILGSSHVYAINPMIVSKYLETNGYKFDVYNLGSPGDDFEERERTLDMIIDKKPKVVMYGIEPRAFESAGRTITQTPNNSLPGIGSINELFDVINLGDKKGIIKNPKFALIRTISSPIEKEIQNNPYPNSPFLKFDPDAKKILQPNELKDIKREYVAKINLVEKNSGLHSLNNIIEKLEKNNIKTIIFVTPHSKFYLNSYPENQAKTFQEILSKISEKNGIEIYSLYEKYAEVNVWHDHTHLAVNNNTNFYPEDVASFIIKELEK